MGLITRCFHTPHSLDMLSLAFLGALHKSGDGGKLVNMFLSSDRTDHARDVNGEVLDHFLSPALFSVDTLYFIISYNCCVTQPNPREILSKCHVHVSVWQLSLGLDHGWRS